MSLKVRCLLCSKILQCTREDTSALLEHIREFHPEVTVLESSEALSHMAPEDQQKKSGGTAGKGEGDKAEGKGAKRLSKDDYNVQRACKMKRSGRKRLYKTSIEKWRPGVGVIFCPKCCKKNTPLVKSHTEKISTSTFGAACILTCWPFCFFPCLFPSPTKEYLHCPICDNFLGVYDKDKSCVRPNKQFVDDEQQGAECQAENPPEKEPEPEKKPEPEPVIEKSGAEETPHAEKKDKKTLKEEKKKQKDEEKEKKKKK